MARDSLFGESIVWTGKPAVLRTPPVYRALAGAAAAMSVVTLLFALVVALALHANVNGMIMFAAWCAVLAVGAWRLPIVWQSRVEYIVTDKHVIWRRGPLRRTIDRKGISYARIHWLAPNVGDLVLVRAVPTGALRRRLMLKLSLCPRHAASSRTVARPLSPGRCRRATRRTTRSPPRPHRPARATQRTHRANPSLQSCHSSRLEPSARAPMSRRYCKPSNSINAAAS